MMIKIKELKNYTYIIIRYIKSIPTNGVVEPFKNEYNLNFIRY